MLIDVDRVGEAEQEDKLLESLLPPEKFSAVTTAADPAATELSRPPSDLFGE